MGDLAAHLLKQQDSLAARLERAEKERDEAVGVIEDLFRLLDEGVLVRDITHDHEDGWALKQIPLVKAIQTGRRILEARVGAKEEK